MRPLSLVSSFVACAAALAQSQLTAITSSSRAHLDAKISPAGGHVAFRVGRTDLGVVPFTGGSENLIFTSATGNLSSLVWDLNSSTIYVADGGTIRSVARSGGNSITLGTVSGTNVMLWCTDGTWLYGSRQNGSQGIVFRVRSNGQGSPADLVTTVGTIDEVAISPAFGYLLIANGSGVPFTAPTMLRHTIQTGTTTTMGQPVYPLNSISWIDEGGNFVAASRTANVGSPQIVRYDLGTNPTPLSEYGQFHRRTQVFGNWIACETLSPTGNGVTVALMPLAGGGAVHVDGGRALLVNGGVQFGGLTMDAIGSKIAVCGGTGSGDPFPQVLVATVAREIEVSPRLETGQPFTIGLPLGAGEIGAVAISFGLTPATPISVPPLVGQFHLDPTPGNLVTALSGLATGGWLSAAWSIPADPGLIGLQIWFQGVRFDPAFQGAFTRFGRYQVF